MLIYFIVGLLVVYGFIIVLLYFIQEKLIFFPEKLEQDYIYHFSGNFEEKWIETADGNKINALLFKADSSKGVILYLHGNAGALNSWGDIAPIYTSLHFDIFIPDYRGFGKSTGKIYSEKQIFDDVQRIYNFLMNDYKEEQIVIMGYSIGTGPASYLAAKNNAKKLILQAPYYNLSDVVNDHYKIIPSFLLKYQFRTNKYIKKVKSPIAIFHGDKDELIYSKSSKKLIKLCKPDDKLFILANQEHGNINDNKEFQYQLKGLLSD
jgi:esterase/lipase